MLDVQLFGRSAKIWRRGSLGPEILLRLVRVELSIDDIANAGKGCEEQ